MTITIPRDTEDICVLFIDKYVRGYVKARVVYHTLPPRARNLLLVPPAAFDGLFDERPKHDIQWRWASAKPRVPQLDDPL